MMKKIIIILAFAFISFVSSICIGSVLINPKEIICIFAYKIFNMELADNINKINIDIIFNIRLPRAILSFFVGASLSMTGVVMQSVLKNPLASVYNLGVSSGAGIGASLIIIFGVYSHRYAFIFSSVIFSFASIIFILFVSERIDKYMNSNSIILAGIVMSLFFNSIMSFLSYTFPKYANQIILWQLGNFSLKDFDSIFFIIILSLIFLALLLKYSAVLDIITFGDDASLTLGVNPKKTRIFFIMISSIITAILVAFVGIIGFVDLVSPHIARKIFKAKHIVVAPTSALLGGILLNFSDIFSRIIVEGANIPIGIVTAVIGAPFFLYIFISKRV